MRAAILLAALPIASPAVAEDFLAAAPVIAATVYPDGAVLTREATLDLPAGHHRVMIPYGSYFDPSNLPRITASDGTAIAMLGYLADMDIDAKALFSPAQAAARDRVEAARADIAAQKDRIATATLGIEASEARLAFITAIRPPATAEGGDLAALAGFVEDEARAVLADIQTRRQDLRALEDALGAYEKELALAEGALERLRPPADRADLVTVELDLPDAKRVTFRLADFADAGWMPDYELRLTTGEDPGLEILRRVAVFQGGPDRWEDIDLTLSTARPSGQIAPSIPYPDHASIETPGVYPLADRSFAMAPEPAIAEDAGVSFAMQAETDGYAVSYHYPGKVTIGAEDAALLFLDALNLPATSEILAAPRQDETAFMVGNFTNSGDEPILAGSAKFFRDGALVGQGQLAAIPAGASATLPFGPIEGLRLKTTFARNETGDSGIISRSNTRDQIITFSVENLTGESQSLTALYALPYSEQEDLRIRLELTPAPDQTDYDDRRGVGAWQMELAPGESATVRIGAHLSWPNNSELNWWP